MEKSDINDFALICWEYFGIIILAVFIIWQTNTKIHYRGYKELWEFIKFIEGIIL